MPVPDEKPLARRLVWFVGLWATGVAAVTALGFLIRSALGL